MANQNTTIAKNTLFLSIRMVFVLFVSLYTSRVFLNVLGVVDYGISNVVAGFVSMFTFLNSALINAVQRYYSFELGKGDDVSFRRVYTTSLIIQSILAIAVAILLETFGLWYIYNKMVIPVERFDAALWVFQFSVLSTLLIILKIPYSSAILSYEKMDFFALVQMLDVVLKLILALLIPYFTKDKLILYGAAYFIIGLVSFILEFAYSKVKFQTLRREKNIKIELFKNMLSFSGWNLFGTFACMIREQGLNMILNLFFGPIVNAARGIAYQVSSAMQGFVNNIGIAAKPQMIQSFAEGNEERTMKLMYTMSKICFIILYLMAVPVCLEIDYILHLWLGENVPEHTQWFLILVVLTSFMNNLNAPLSNVVYATGEMKKYEVTFGLINVLILPLSYISLKNGAAPEYAFVIYFVMSIVVQTACLIVVRSLVKLSILSYILELILPLMLMVVLSFILPYIIHITMAEGAGRMIVVCASSFVASLTCTYFIALNNKERGLLNEIIKKSYTKIRKYICL